MVCECSLTTMLMATHSRTMGTLPWQSTKPVQRKTVMAPKFTRVREHATIGTRCARDASMLNFRQWFAIVHGLQQFHHEELAHIVVRLLGPDFHEYGSSLQHVSKTALGGKDC
jgi:hypothetical protein